MDLSADERFVSVRHLFVDSMQGRVAYQCTQPTRLSRSCAKPRYPFTGVSVSKVSFSIFSSCAKNQREAEEIRDVVRPLNSDPSASAHAACRESYSIPSKDALSEQSQRVPFDCAHLSILHVFLTQLCTSGCCAARAPRRNHAGTRPVEPHGPTTTSLGICFVKECICKHVLEETTCPRTRS
jgi:hypothetical protein